MADSASMQVSELLHSLVNLLAMYEVGRAALLAAVSQDGVFAPARESWQCNRHCCKY